MSTTLGQVVSESLQGGDEYLVVDDSGNVMRVEGNQVHHPGKTTYATFRASLRVVVLGVNDGPFARPEGHLRTFATQCVGDMDGYDATGAPISHRNGAWMRPCGANGDLAFPLVVWEARGPQMVALAETGVSTRGSLRERLGDAIVERDRFEAQPPLGLRALTAGRAFHDQVVKHLRDQVEEDES